MAYILITRTPLSNFIPEKYADLLRTIHTDHIFSVDNYIRRFKKKMCIKLNTQDARFCAMDAD